MAMIISLNIDAGCSRLRSRSFDLLHITKGVLNSRSRDRKHHGNGEQNLNVGEGHTLCLTSQEQNSVASSFNDKLFSSKMTNLKAFHSSLVSVLSTSAGVEKTFPSYSISVVSP